MPKSEKTKVNVKEKVEDNNCDLSLCDLSEVPVKEIASFKRVNVLDLSSNRLISLGKNFAILTRLVKLDLSKNQIKYLPDDFGLLRNLRHLDLYDNRLEHLPLSFGNLGSLRYLDLKGNPLIPALAKIVGLCLTSKECQESARNTVKFLSHMQNEAEKAKEQFRLELHNQIEEGEKENFQISEFSRIDNKTSKKQSNKKTKSKAKKGHNTIDHNMGTTKENNTETISNHNNKMIASKSKKHANGGYKKNTSSKVAMAGTAFTSIFTFVLLLSINIMIIYMIMFRHPEVVEKVVEYIPHQYRDWIVTKTESYRLRVTDWIAEFRTAPEEQ